MPRSQGSLSIELCILKGTRGGLHITAQLNPIGGEIGVLVLVWGGAQQGVPLSKAPREELKVLKMNQGQVRKMTNSIEI